jgi:hypothetical protein
MPLRTAYVFQLPYQPFSPYMPHAVCGVGIAPAADGCARRRRLAIRVYAAQPAQSRVAKGAALAQPGKKQPRHPPYQDAEAVRLRAHWRAPGIGRSLVRRKTRVCALSNIHAPSWCSNTSSGEGAGTDGSARAAQLGNWMDRRGLGGDDGARRENPSTSSGRNVRNCVQEAWIWSSGRPWPRIARGITTN